MGCAQTIPYNPQVEDSKYTIGTNKTIGRTTDKIKGISFCPTDCKMVTEKKKKPNTGAIDV